jgi:hypothetical protein
MVGGAEGADDLFDKISGARRQESAPRATVGTPDVEALIDDGNVMAAAADARGNLELDAVKRAEYSHRVIPWFRRGLGLLERGPPRAPLLLGGRAYSIAPVLLARATPEGRLIACLFK